MDPQQRDSFITLFEPRQTQVGRAVRAATECSHRSGPRDSWWLGAALRLKNWSLKISKLEELCKHMTTMTTLTTGCVSCQRCQHVV